MLSLPESAPWIVPTVPIAVAAALRRPRTWYFWGTAFFAVIACLVQSIAATLTFLVLLACWVCVVPHTPEELRALIYDGAWLALAAIMAGPFVLAVLWGAIRLARQRFADYLALRWPSGRELARGLAMTCAFLLVWLAIAYLTGQKAPAFVINGYMSARATGWLPVYLIAMCIAAPVTEEFFVRGFLFRGWSQSFLRPTGAIVLSSAVWAAAHTQYNLFYVSEIFTIGLLLGYLRYRYGSTWLTVIIHSAINLAAVIEVALIVAYA
ncbi:hypothetical protein SAMN05444159_7062 [Bradyrhizobium lablabi]|uniref:CAAX prenyl protease 2/Lysostaphin resistance protein A-like domain-containing protein n=1 Tax=Bradyrhizobium lablabi TaxID=722472 RepID=A0A1M7E750_9BRAD|nr:type II CAAX endopeptidase family protein [Bradyrhizobium lablabi]SHL87500.1 hypothetical protein SAMN05444159_7062 [Bradyrhizobium lablabi]